MRDHCKFDLYHILNLESDPEERGGSVFGTLIGGHCPVFPAEHGLILSMWGPGESPLPSLSPLPWQGDSKSRIRWLHAGPCGRGEMTRCKGPTEASCMGLGGRTGRNRVPLEEGLRGGRGRVSTRLQRLGAAKPLPSSPSVSQESSGQRTMVSLQKSRRPEDSRTRVMWERPRPAQQHGGQGRWDHIKHMSSERQAKAHALRQRRRCSRVTFDPRP